MPDSAFFIWITPERRILVLRSTTKGRYISFSVVLMVLTPEGWVDVSRFDSAHGIPHRDILGSRKGLLQKVWFDDISPKEVFHMGIQTFRDEHERIIAEYFAN
jgi:hypothetical protein